MGLPDGNVGSMRTSFQCSFTVFDFLAWAAPGGAPGGGGGAPSGGGGGGGSPPPGGGGGGGGPNPGIMGGGGGGALVPPPCIPPKPTVFKKFVSSALFKSVKSMSLSFNGRRRFFSSSSHCKSLSDFLTSGGGGGGGSKAAGLGAAGRLELLSPALAWLRSPLKFPSGAEDPSPGAPPPPSAAGIPPTAIRSDKACTVPWLGSSTVDGGRAGMEDGPWFRLSMREARLSPSADNRFCCRSSCPGDSSLSWLCCLEILYNIHRWLLDIPGIPGAGGGSPPKSSPWCPK